jgi:hypothetical protein
MLHPKNLVKNFNRMHKFRQQPFSLSWALFSFTGAGIYRLVIDEWAGDHQFPLYSRVNYTAYFLTLGLGGLLFIGANILLALRSINQTDSQQHLEKILRYRY